MIFVKCMIFFKPQELDLNLGELDLTSQDEFILDEVNG
jgi:hypothetical protein